MLPFQMKEEPEFEVGDYIFIPNMKEALSGNMKEIPAYVGKAQALAGADGAIAWAERFSPEGMEQMKAEGTRLTLYIADLTQEEKEIIQAGCLINYNRNRHNKKK